MLCSLVILSGEAASAHHSIGTVVHQLAVLMAPLAGFDKRAGACLVDEVVVEELYGWQCGTKRVATHGYPAFVSLASIYAKAKSAVIYAH